MLVDVAASALIMAAARTADWEIETLFVTIGSIGRRCVATECTFSRFISLRISATRRYNDIHMYIYARNIWENIRIGRGSWREDNR